MLLQATPADDEGGPWLGFVVPTATAPPATRCPLTLLLNGEPLPLPDLKHTATETAGQYSTAVELDILERIGDAERVAGQMCGARFLLNKQQQQAVRAFVVRVKEERAFAGPAPAADPAADPTAGQPTEPAAEPATEPATEPAIDPVAEPAAGPATDGRPPETAGETPAPPPPPAEGAPASAP